MKRGRPLAGGPALAGDAGRSGSGPILLAEQGPGSTGGVTGGLLGSTEGPASCRSSSIRARAACACRGRGRSLRLGFGCRGSRGASGPGRPGSPRRPPSSSGRPRLSSQKDSSGPPHPRQAASGEGCGCPRAWLPARSPGPRPLSLKTGRTRLGVCGLWRPAPGSGEQGASHAGWGHFSPPVPKRQPALAPLVFSRRICSGILWKGGCGRHAWVPGPRAGLCLSHAEPRAAESPGLPGPGDSGNCSRPPQRPDAPGGQQAHYSAQFKGGDRGPGVAWTTPGRIFKLFP